jgi:hypothetical protein
MAIESSDLLGGAKPPILLDDTLQLFAGGSSPRTVIVPDTGCQQSASITSASLTEVLNKTNGVISLAAIHTATGTAVTNAKFRIVLDGVEVLNSTGTLSDQDSIRCAIGTYSSGTGGRILSREEIPYKTLVIEISGDGTNGTILSFLQYDT